MRNMPPLVALFVLMLGASTPSAIWAAEAATKTDSPSDTVADGVSASAPGEDDQATDATQPETPQSGESSDSEVFIPTEEISEDFAVSFPVDI